MNAGQPTWTSRRWLIPASLIVLLAVTLSAAGGRGPFAIAVPVVVVLTAIAVTTWTIIRTRSERQEYERRLVAWSSEQAAQAERLRVARDLHDLVSHGLGLITVRAAAARRTTGGNASQEWKSALSDVENISRETTTELRRMLTVFRAGPAETPPLRPASTFADLPTIAQEAREAGVQVSLDVPDSCRASLGAQLTICVVVREALNNCLRHAGPTQATVKVRRDGNTLVTTIIDDGPARSDWHAAPGAGRGLLGLSERVRAVGGTLEAAAAGPGFLLRACIPDKATTA